jgi:hypothetical protein
VVTDPTAVGGHHVYSHFRQHRQAAHRQLAKVPVLYVMYGHLGLIALLEV